MKIVSGIIMLIGAFITAMEFLASESAPQQAASVVYVIGAYVTGRALENFSITKKPSPSTSINEAVPDISDLIVATQNDYEFIYTQFQTDKPELMSRLQWANIVDNKMKYNYKVIEYYKHKD